MAKFYVVLFDVDSKTSVVHSDNKKVLSRQKNRCEVRWSKNITYEGGIVGEAGKLNLLACFQLISFPPTTIILSCCLDGFVFPSQETKDEAVAIEKKIWNKDFEDSSPHISPIKRKQPSAKHSTPKPTKKRVKASPADLEKERKKAAQEEKRKAKQAQIAAGRELANKLFLSRTPHSGSETSESEDEDPLQKAKKKNSRR